jgi:hypothetical protein
MTNRILCSALVAAVLVWPLAACQSASDSRVQIVKTSIAEDPDLEVVATDEGAGILTVRVKSSNELVTVNVNELKEGEPLVIKTRGAGGQSAAVTVQGQGSGVTVATSGADSSAPAAATGAAGAAVTLEAERGERRGSVGVSGGAGNAAVSLQGKSGKTLDIGVAQGVAGAAREVAVAAQAERPAAERGVTAAAGDQTVAITGRDGKRLEIAVEPALPNLRPRRGPITCSGRDNLRLEGLFIDVPDDNALVIEGGCDVVIVHSHIASGRTAIVAMGSGDIEIEDSVIEGRQASMSLSGSADAAAANTTFVGRLQRSGQAKFADRGGNVWK